jgi:hypothetical protein
MWKWTLSPLIVSCKKQGLADEPVELFKIDIEGFGMAPSRVPGKL